MMSPETDWETTIAGIKESLDKIKQRIDDILTTPQPLTEERALTNTTAQKPSKKENPSQ